MITESKIIIVNTKAINIRHEGHDPLSEESLKAVYAAVELDLHDGQTTGFYQYSNFECGISWDIQK